MIDIISLVASLATLLLFIFYFVGRIWSIRIRKNEVHEKVVFLENDLDEQELDILINRKLFYSFGDEVVAKIIFEQPIRWVKVCKTDHIYSDEQSVQEDIVLHTVTDLSAGSVFYVQATIPDVFQPYWIEYERYDYSRARIFLVYSGLSGNMAMITNLALTVKSWAYYLIR